MVNAGTAGTCKGQPAPLRAAGAVSRLAWLLLTS